MDDTEMMFLIWNSEYLRLKPIVENIIQNEIIDEEYISNILGHLHLKENIIK